MPNKIKYTKEQRQKVHELYQIGRCMHESYMKGKYTLKQISERTGVSVASVWCISKGLR